MKKSYLLVCPVWCLHFCIRLELKSENWFPLEDFFCTLHQGSNSNSALLLLPETRHAQSQIPVNHKTESGIGIVPPNLFLCHLYNQRPSVFSPPRPPTPYVPTASASSHHVWRIILVVRPQFVAHLFPGPSSGCTSPTPHPPDCH